MSKEISDLSGETESHSNYASREERSDPEAALKACNELIKAIDNIMDNIDKSFFSEEIAKIDIEKADAYLAMYGIDINKYAHDSPEQKAFQEVFVARNLLKRYPKYEYSKLLNEKLEILEKVWNK